MKNAIEIISERISNAIEQATGQKAAAMVTAATDAKFGDYQSNSVFALAKQLKTNPRQLAEKVVAVLKIDDICLPPEIAGAGFINLRLKPEFVAGNLLKIAADQNLDIEKTSKPQTVVVDFSGPNIAKQMHVGHLRSTIIGDCICRMLEFVGNNVIRQNHIGDWGTQFGRAFLGLWHISMGKEHLDPYYREELADLRACAKDRNKLIDICKQICGRHADNWRADKKNELGNGEMVFWPYVQRLLCGKEDIELEEIEVAYQYVSQIDDAIEGMGLVIPTRERDPKTNEWQEILIPYEDLSRRITAMLQKGGEDNKQEKQVWDYITQKTADDMLYRLLGVTLNKNHVRGESFYKDMLPDVINDLKKLGLAVESDGAVCVFPDKEKFKTKEGEPLPFIIQKSDGAYLYATTDLAALRYRVNELKADRIIYVTDARQKLHFEMLFAVAKMAGWASDKILLEHITFGSVLGEDGKPLKTRSGENVKLKELLDEAVKRAKAVVEEKNSELSTAEKEKIANAVGIGAVKYADYSNNRTSDYIFSFDKMLAMEGNTAPYMQYAYARVKSIGRKAEQKGINVENEINSIKTLNLVEPAEHSLAKHLIRYGQSLNTSLSDLKPNFLTSYLYELAQEFSGFYNACPVLDAPPQNRPTRLLLCELTARTIKHGLESLLGIETIDRM